MSYLGIDLHSNRFTVEKLALGKTIETVRNTYGFDETSFGRFKETLGKNDCVLVENTFNAFWFRDQIADQIDTCLVYNTNVGRAEGNKTDKIDGVPRRPPFLWVRDPPWQLPVQPCSEECMERGNPGP
jgi:hypothetical protein